MLALALFLALAPPDCEARVDAVNARVRSLELKAQLADASQALRTFKAECFELLSPRRQAWLVSDLALVAHKLGDDARCLAVLKEAPPTPADSVIARALRFNAGLCGAPCAGDDDVACDAGKRGLARRRAEVSDVFRSPACPIWPSSLAVTARPPNGGDVTECVQLVPAVVGRCPRLAVIDKTASGRIKRREVEFTDGRIAAPEDCCNFTALTVKSGDPAATPGSQSSLLRVRGTGHDCAGGTAVGDFDEEFLWNGTTLTLEHDDNVVAR